MKQNKSALILITIIFITCGLFLIFRGLLTVDNFRRLNGTIKGKKICENKKYNEGKYYSLNIALLETDIVYGVYLGTKDQAENDDLINKITVGSNYTFYIDPRVFETINGANLGIRIIKQNEHTIYKESNVFNFICGGILISFGVLNIIILIYLKRKKNRK